MSWLFSRALVEEYSQESSSDGARSALLSGSPTPQAFLPSDKMTDFSRPSRFGMTFGPLTDDLGAELLTWFLGDSHVRTLALLAKATDSTESAADCGPKWRGSLARYDRGTRSWKTAQHSLLEDSSAFAETWPQWGTTVGGELYLLPELALPIEESGYGLLPTPLKSWGRRGPGVSNNLENLRNSLGTTQECLAIVAAVGWRWPPSFLEWMMGWPLQWSALKPLETVKFHNAQLTLGESLAGPCDGAFAVMVAKGTQAWSEVSDDWLDELRGGKE